MVEFRAPSPPDPSLAYILQNVDRIGVISITTVEPVRELDIEKLMGRMADGVAQELRNLPETSVLTQDDIRWHFNYADFDSVSLMAPATRARLRDELDLDAMVYVELSKMEAQVTPVSPTQTGNMGATPGLDLSVRLHVTLMNLHTDAQWRFDRGELRNWQPFRTQQAGRDQTERQMLTALSPTLRQFLARVAPPPRRQVRHFEVSGD